MKTAIKNLFLRPSFILLLGLVMAGQVKAQTWNLSVLHTFSAAASNGTNADGKSPIGGLVLAGNVLYGAAYVGGKSGVGTVFAVQADGIGFTNLHQFAGGSDAANPRGGFFIASNTLYGASWYGGSPAAGTLFKLNTDGTAYKVLYTFPYNTVATNGYSPNEGLILSGNLLYGTTLGGGTPAQGESASSVWGTLFDFNINTLVAGNLHNFTENPDGAIPVGGVTLANGILYGTTQNGGTYNQFGVGTVFSCNASGAGGVSILHSFNFPTDGGGPNASLVLSSNLLYGTAPNGGAGSEGTVFGVSTNGAIFTNLYSFTAMTTNAMGVNTNADGAEPNGVILSGNTLYGTTLEGGTEGNGTIYSLTMTDSGVIFSNLYNFTATHTNALGVKTNSDGVSPASLILSNNIFYGVTGSGGRSGSGTVFSLFFGTPNPPLTVTTTSLPDGLTNTLYSLQLAASGGQIPYTWTTNAGSLPKGITLSASGLLAGTPTTGGLFNFTVQAMDAVGAEASEPLSLQITTKPILTITSPKNGAKWSNDVFSVTGTAQDSALAISNVLVSVNDGVWTKASLTVGNTNWTAQINLTPGTNIITAYAVDAAGNVSTTSTDALDYVVTAALTVQTNGDGGISPGDNGAVLLVGNSYTLTATAKTGAVFTNWTDGQGDVITNGATLKFVMASGLVLVANFVEVAKPSLTIAAPTNLQKMTNALAHVRGTASDDWGIASVWYQLNNGAWRLPETMNKWTNWAVTLPLMTGTNQVNAYAVDLGGNLSTTSSVSVISSNTFKLNLAFTNAVPLKTNGLVFNLQLSPGLSGQVQVSSNFLNWVVFTNFTGSSTNLTFRDPAAAKASWRFYRAVSP